MDEKKPVRRGGGLAETIEIVDRTRGVWKTLKLPELTAEEAEVVWDFLRPLEEAGVSSSSI